MIFFQKIIPFIFLSLIFICSCTNIGNKEKIRIDKSETENPVYIKPHSNYQDTLWVDVQTAVLFHPDSLQLLAIKEITDERVFKATTHEFFYQMRNARIVLKKDWPKIKIIEAKNIRYLHFKKTNHEGITIDLDTKGDPYGLFLFDTLKDPLLIDMTNIDTQLYFYFTKK